jgi:O-antigen/teichoic acid export membrane protein
VFFGAEALFDTYSEEFIKDLRIISFIFISEAVFMVMKTLAIVKLNFSFAGIRSTLNKFIQAGILVYFFAQGDLGLKQLIWSIVIASALSVLILIPAAFKMYGTWTKVAAYKSSLLLSILTTYGTWDFVRQIGNRATFRIRPWLIKLFISTEAVAIYSIAEMIISTLQDLLPAKTLQSLVPFWIQDKNLGAKMFSYGVKYFIVTGIVIALGALVIVPPVVYTFFAKYSESMPLFYFMVLNLPIFAAGIILGNYLIALRRQKFLFFHNTFRNALALTVIVSTVPFIGLWGLALEFVLIPLVMIIITELYLRRKNPELRIDPKVLFSYGPQDREFVQKVIAIIRGWILRGREKVLG